MLEYDPLGGRLESAVEAEGWTSTGDLVEIRDDRVIFVGRETDFINVGGYKVNPNKVEQVLRRLAGVANVRVFGQTSSVTGQIVACEVVPSAGVTKETLLQAIRERAVEQLDRYHRPRIINIVDRIQLSRAGKVKRNDDPS
jgi:acyl-coenzyme A synthetase/AMP-(fatty) acid ligase